jgi:hypothetical protein
MKIEVVQAVGILITAFALFINAYFSYRRLIHDEKSRNISASEPLLNQWTSAQMQEGIFFVVTRLRKEHSPTEGLSSLPSEDFKKVNYVTQVCDRIGARVVYGEAHYETVAALIGSKIIELWKILEPYIKVDRAAKDSAAPDLRCFFEAIACSFQRLDLPRDTTVR